MTGYGQFCAVARSLALLGERWTLLVVRELLMGATTFTEIQRGLPRIPRATLSARLRTLRTVGVVTATPAGYRLTESGAALAPVLRELARWATVTDSAALTDDDLDTAALTWDMQRRIDRDALPERTVVLALEFTDRGPADRRFWLHLSRTEVNLCREDTGAPVDAWLTAPSADTIRWWLGELSWADLLRQPGVTVHGNATLQRQIHRWFLRYAFAAADRRSAPGSAGSFPRTALRTPAKPAPWD